MKNKKAMKRATQSFHKLWKKLSRRFNKCFHIDLYLFLQNFKHIQGLDEDDKMYILNLIRKGTITRTEDVHAEADRLKKMKKIRTAFINQLGMTWEIIQEKFKEQTSDDALLPYTSKQ